MASLKDKEKIMQDEIEQFKATQKEIQKFVSKRKQLEGQLTENKTVKEEMDLLEDDAVIYKLIGPALIKQELGEAKITVDKRLEYINREIENCEESLKEQEKKHQNTTEKLAKLQQEYQQAMMANK
jgi:prefoldin beta subunit